MTRRALLAVLAVVGLTCSLPETAHAQMSCRVTLQDFAFGTYLPGAGSPLDVTGSVDLSCSGRPGTFLVTMGTGSSGSFASRTMISGAFAMLYNLFRDSGRTLVWGDGTGGSVVSGGVKSGLGREDFSLPVYGRVPPAQSVGAGLYQDSILVTVAF